MVWKQSFGHLTIQLLIFSVTFWSFLWYNTFMLLYFSLKDEILCIYNICICMHLCAHSCICAYGCQRLMFLMLGASSTVLHIIFLGWGLSCNLELTYLTIIDGQWVPRIFLSLLPQCWSYWLITTALLFMLVLGIWAQSLGLYDIYLASWSICLSPRFLIFVTKDWCNMNQFTSDLAIFYSIC